MSRTQEVRDATVVPRVGPLEAVSFLCELSMLVILALAGAAATDSLLGKVMLAVALPVVAAGVWAVWMAPTSGRRLPNPARLYVQVALFAVTAVVAGAFLVPLVGLVFFVVATAVFGELCRRELRAR